MFSKHVPLIELYYRYVAPQKHSFAERLALKHITCALACCKERITKSFWFPMAFTSVFKTGGRWGLSARLSEFLFEVIWINQTQNHQCFCCQQNNSPQMRAWNYIDNQNETHALVILPPRPARKFILKKNCFNNFTSSATSQITYMHLYRVRYHILPKIFPIATNQKQEQYLKSSLSNTLWSSSDFAWDIFFASR